jgi:hypothetical protein
MSAMSQPLLDPASLPQVDRRTERRTPPPLGELVVESGWRPTDRPSVHEPSWLIAHGYAPERRARARRGA